MSRVLKPHVVDPLTNAMLFMDYNDLMTEAIQRSAKYLKGKCTMSIQESLTALATQFVDSILAAVRAASVDEFTALAIPAYRDVVLDGMTRQKPSRLPINGILQTDILAQGIGAHVFCEPMSFRPAKKKKSRKARPAKKAKSVKKPAKRARR